MLIFNYVTTQIQFHSLSHREKVIIIYFTRSSFISRKSTFFIFSAVTKLLKLVLVGIQETKGGDTVTLYTPTAPPLTMLYASAVQGVRMMLIHLIKKHCSLIVLSFFLSFHY